MPYYRFIDWYMCVSSVQYVWWWPTIQNLTFSMDNCRVLEVSFEPYFPTDDETIYRLLKCLVRFWSMCLALYCRLPAVADKPWFVILILKSIPAKFKSLLSTESGAGITTGLFNLRCGLSVYLGWRSWYLQIPPWPGCYRKQFWRGACDWPEGTIKAQSSSVTEATDEEIAEAAKAFNAPFYPHYLVVITWKMNQESSNISIRDKVNLTIARAFGWSKIRFLDEPSSVGYLPGTPD